MKTDTSADRAPHVIVGVAGWSYRDWEGIVYPSGGGRDFDALRYLAGYFDLIEINSSFYHPPTERVARDWLARVEEYPGFAFSMKVWQVFTHGSRRWGAPEISRMLRAAESLVESGRLRALLLQFPWSFKRGEEERLYLAGLFQVFAGFPLVLEVRHESWIAAPFLDWLGEQGVALCSLDQPVFRGSMKPAAFTIAGRGYVRLHGRNRESWFDAEAGRDERYDYHYRAEELAEWSTRLAGMGAGGGEVIAVTNNHFRGQAVANALVLKSMCAGCRVEVPDSLMEHFPELARVSNHPPRQGSLF